MDSRSASGGAPREGYCFCAFWLCGQLYAVDVAHVGEVIQVGDLITVPLAPDCVLGMCPLRGRAITVLDLGQFLGLGGCAAADALSLGQAAPRALMLRGSDLFAAVLIDRIETVQPFENARLKPCHAEPDGPPLRGVLELGAGDLRASLLDGHALLARIAELNPAATTAAH